ncbi:MAG: cytidylate kinase family protein [Rhodomicrobium sp.]
MAVIAMTREMGTLGKDVAAGLAERLGLDLVHHNVVKQDIVASSGLPESDVHRFLEGETSLLDRWRIDRRRMRCSTAREILELAAKRNVLIRGWGSVYLLRSVSHVLSVRCAPMEFREQVLMRRLGLKDRAAARREIERDDAAHNGTMQRMFGIDWTDPAHYSIVLNTARIPVQECVDCIVGMVQTPAFAETEQSKAELMNQLISARIRSALDRHFGSDAGALVKIEVNAGQAVLTGQMVDAHYIAEAVRFVRSVEGVTGVESRIVPLGFQPMELS